MIGKIPFKPKWGFVLPGHKFTGPYNPLDKQLDSRDRPKVGNEPFNAVDATSMRHDICYRDNPGVKSDYDRIMLTELKTIVPRNRREAVGKQLVRGIIGLKYKLAMSVWRSQLADETCTNRCVGNTRNDRSLQNRLTIFGQLIWQTCHRFPDLIEVTSSC